MQPFWVLLNQTVSKCYPNSEHPSSNTSTELLYKGGKGLPWRDWRAAAVTPNCRRGLWNKVCPRKKDVEHFGTSWLMCYSNVVNHVQDEHWIHLGQFWMSRSCRFDSQILISFASSFSQPNFKTHQTIFYFLTLISPVECTCFQHNLWTNHLCPPVEMKSWTLCWSQTSNTLLTLYN